MELHEVIAYAGEKLGRKIEHVEEIYEGYKSKVHYISIDGTMYVLKIKPMEDIMRIKHKNSILDKLSNSGLRLPKIVMWHPEFSIMEKLEGTTLEEFTEVRGIHILDENVGAYSIFLKELGEYFSDLHILKDKKDFLTYLKGELKKAHTVNEFEGIYQYVYRNMHNLITGYTHGDINNKRNIMVEVKSGKLRMVGMVDFETLNEGITTHDIEDILSSVLNNSKECTDIFLDSYLKDKNSKVFINRMFLSYSYEHLTDWYNGNEEDRRGNNNYVELLKIREVLKDYSKLGILEPFQKIDTKYYL